MQAQTADHSRTVQRGRMWMALPALLVFAACANSATSPTTGAAGSGMRVAGENVGGNTGQSVSSVSDALGARVDGMLGGSHGTGH